MSPAASWGVLAVVLAASLAGCSDGHRNQMRVIVSNPTHDDVDVWLRIESVRGDTKYNEPVHVPAGEAVEFSMGDLQGMLRFTAIVLGHAHSETEQMEPDEDWTIDIRDDGSTCFFFYVEDHAEPRCG